jgi:hypothetical protein
MQIQTIMLHKSAFFRAMAVPACIVWGVFEFVALQRSRLRARSTQMSAPSGRDGIDRGFW